MRYSLAVALAALAMVASPASAQVTFGANLGRAANNPGYDCQFFPGPGPFGGSIPYPSGNQTCTWFTAGSAGDNYREGFDVPPGNGVVTRVRVKTGASTGPMQAVILETVRPANVAPPEAACGPGNAHPCTGSGNALCCKAVAESAVFTPPTNTVFPQDVNLPVRHDVQPNPSSGYYSFDTIALSVLQPGVLIPLNDTGDYDSPNTIASAALFPAMHPPREQAGVTGVTGYQVLMNADWVPGGGGSAGSTTPGVAFNPGISLASRTARIRNGNAFIRVLCNLNTACSGLLALQDAVARGAVATKKKKKKRGRKKTKTYARGKYNVPPHKKKTVKAKLTKSGNRLMRKHKTARVWVNVTVGGKTGAVGKVKLVRGSKRRKKRR